MYRDIKKDLLLGSITGGTDIVGCFAGNTPMLPVNRGEIQCRLLGMAMEGWDETGNLSTCIYLKIWDMLRIQKISCRS